MKYSFSLLIFANLLFFGICKLKSSPVPEYDSFIFAIQWGNNICDDADADCNSKLSQIDKNTMSIHGLWPALSNGEKLAPCNSGTEIQVKLEGLNNIDKLKAVWPSLTEYENTDFWTYEFNKHGYCYVVKNNLPGYGSYFNKAVEVFYANEYPTIFQKAFPAQKGEVSITHQELIEKVDKVLPGQYFKFLCKKVNNKQYVTEIYISLGLNFSPKETKMAMSCPTTQNLYLKFK